MVAKHRRASVLKAPEGRHIGSPHRCNTLFMRGRRPLQGQRVFLGRGLATNILARWATIRWAHACRTSPVTRGRRPRRGQRIFLSGACYQYVGPLGHNPLGTCLPHKPRNARSAAPTGPTCFSWSGLATNILARWATIRWAHTCRINPVTRGRRPRRGQRVFLDGACYQ